MLTLKKLMLTLQSFKSWSVCLLVFEVKRNGQDDVILLSSQGVSFTEVYEGLNAYRKIPVHYQVL